MMWFMYSWVLCFSFGLSGCSESKSFPSHRVEIKSVRNINVSVVDDPIKRIERIVGDEIIRIEDEIIKGTLVLDSLQWFLNKYSEQRTLIKDETVIKQVDLYLYESSKHIFEPPQEITLLHKVVSELKIKWPEIFKIYETAKNNSQQTT
jgi:hypothetical protein